MWRGEKSHFPRRVGEADEGLIKDTGLQRLSFLPCDDFSFLSREGSVHVGMCRK